MSLADYHQTTSDWRGQLKKNEHKTRWIIATFIAIYVMIGLIVDVYILQSTYPGAPFTQYLYALVTFKAPPYATLIMLVIATVSLWLTFILYDKLMLLGTDSREITPETAKNIQEKQLFHVVDEMRVASGLGFMPKVYLIEANYMNAFASGFSEKSAMLAITRGLLEKLDRAELQAVMAHELSHIRHHDIKVTLMVAILSNILLIVVDLLFYSFVFGKDRKEDNRLLMVIMILRYVLPLITVVLALFLSRTREYMADSGAVELTRDNEPLARALIKISEDHEHNASLYAQEYGQTAHEEVRNASYIYNPSMIDPVKSLSQIFSTHPSLSSRLKALGYKEKSNKV